MISDAGSLVLFVDSFVDSYYAKSWKQLYDPDIDHLINPQVIDPIIWKPKDMISPEGLKNLRVSNFHD